MDLIKPRDVISLTSVRSALLFVRHLQREDMRSNRESGLMDGRFKIESRKSQSRTQSDGGASTRRRHEASFVVALG